MNPVGRRAATAGTLATALLACVTAPAQPAVAGTARSRPTTGVGPTATLRRTIIAGPGAGPGTLASAPNSTTRRPIALRLGSGATGRPGPTVSISFVLALPAPPALTPAGDAWLRPLWQQAGAAYGVPWQVLAAINRIESDDGRNMGPSSAGAVGWMQFLPSTWARFGIDANRDGHASPWNAADAIEAAARYLAAAGAQRDLPQAIFAYNHAWWYVTDVLTLARRYGWH